MITGITGDTITETITRKEIREIKSKLSKINKNSKLEYNFFEGYWTKLDNKTIFIGYGYESIMKKLNKIHNNIRINKINKIINE